MRRTLKIAGDGSWSSVVLVLALSFAPLPGGAHGQDVGPAPETTKLDIRWSPIIDLHFYARAIEADPKAEKPAELQPLFDAIGRLNKIFGKDIMSWGALEGNLPGCQTAADVKKVFVDLPEKLTLRGRGATSPKEIEFRAIALDLAGALEQVEKYYLEKLAPVHEKLVKDAQMLLAGYFLEKERDCLGFIILHLGGKDPGKAIPVYLVSTMMFPEAVTMRRPEGAGGVCFLAVRGVEKFHLIELILHESTHAMDVVWGEDSGLAQLRTKLAAVLPAESRDLHDIPHTLMFVQSGETVSRLLKKRYKHYGDSSRYYAKVANATKAVMAPWMEYLDGKISREQAFDKMVEAAKQPKP